MSLCLKETHRGKKSSAKTTALISTVFILLFIQIVEVSQRQSTMSASQKQIQRAKKPPTKKAPNQSSTPTATAEKSGDQLFTSKVPLAEQQSSSHLMELPERTSAAEDKYSSSIANLATAPSAAKEERTLIAYVHQLSPPQRNKRNTLDYSRLVLQTENERSLEALLYSKAKRRILENSESSHTPIKIQRFTYTDDKKKIIINDMTNVSVPDQTEYCFQFKDFIQSPTVSIEQILSSCNEWDMVTLSGKAVHVTETQTIPSKRLKFAKGTFADKTGVIQVDIWEQCIPIIKQGQMYQISPIQVRVWKEQKKLSTTFHSVVTEIQEESLAQLTVSEDQIKFDEPFPVEIKVPNINSVEQLQTLIHCVNCSRKIIQATAAKIVRCDICQHSMRAENCKTQLHAKLVLKPAEGETFTLTAFQSTLSTVVENISNLSQSEIIERLLLIDNITLKYNPKTFTITALSIS